MQRTGTFQLSVASAFFDFSGKSTIDVYPSSLLGAEASLAVDVVLNVQVLGDQKLRSGILDFASCELPFADSCRMRFSGIASSLGLLA